MAVAQHMGELVLEMPSFSDSEASLSTKHEYLAQNRHQQPRERSRPRYSPSRLPLRTAFKTFSAVSEIIVGDDSDRAGTKTKYLVHKELLTAASPFFAAALNSTFAEGMSQEVRLPEEKPDIFEWFLQWLYTGSLTIPYADGHGPQYPVSVGAARHHGLIEQAAAHHHSGDYWITQTAHSVEHMARMDGGLRNHQGSPKYFLLIDLYALSDRLLTTPFSNYILTTIARLSEATNSVPTPSDTCILYDNIRESSPLRTLIIDLFAYKKTDKLLETHKDEWHCKFLRELVVKLKRPGPEAIERHSLESWRPRSWSSTRACECCKDTLKPDIRADKCALCEKAFCSGCLRKNGANLAHDTSGCKPWMGRGICTRYHEHVDGDSCV